MRASFAYQYQPLNFRVFAAFSGSRLAPRRNHRAMLRFSHFFAAPDIGSASLSGCRLRPMTVAVPSVIVAHFRVVIPLRK